MNNPEAKEQARRLFFQSKLTRPQIAAVIGVTPRTLFEWIREGDWKSARYAAAHAPMIITETYYHQLSAMNKTISEREDRPYPTKEEAEIMRKLTLTIKQVKLRHGLSEIVELMTVFSNYIKKTKPSLIPDIMPCMDSFVKSIKTGPINPADQYALEFETSDDWQQYLRDLHEPEDLTDLQNFTSQYTQNIDQQKRDHPNTM